MTTCEYCGKTKKEDTFYIGAPPNQANAWTMFEGTGKIACPDCNGLGSYAGQKAIHQHTKLGEAPSLEACEQKALNKPSEDNMKEITDFFDWSVATFLYSISEGALPQPYTFNCWDFEGICEYLMDKNSHRFGHIKNYFEYPLALKIISEPEKINLLIEKHNRIQKFNLPIKKELLDMTLIIGE